MFVTRLISGIVLVAVALLTICSGGWILYGTLTIVSLIGMFELYRAVKVQKQGENLLAVVGYLGVILHYILLSLGYSEYAMMNLIIVLIAMMFVYVFSYPKYHAEQVMAAFFGVADLAQLDPSLDSWPLDKGGIDAILQSGNWEDAVGGDVDDGDDAPADAPQNLRGFHTAEYLLFEDGEAKKITDLDANKIGYLKAVVGRMSKDTELLLKGWTEGKNLENGAYKDAMKAPNGTYSISNIKQSVAMILNSDNGAEGIANEVGATKIGDPVDKWNSGDKEGGVLAVESWYSWNSLNDYTDNIYSIRNAYYGSLDGTVASASLCSIMKKVNPTLNDMVVKQIQETITAINDIPHPFRNNLGATTEVKNAQNQCAFLCSGLALVRGKLAGE